LILLVTAGGVPIDLIAALPSGRLAPGSSSAVTAGSPYFIGSGIHLSLYLYYICIIDKIKGFIPEKPISLQFFVNFPHRK
jgi:hypothetical protein